MNTIFREIKKQIAEHPKVKNSILDTISEWKRTQFIVLEKIISDELKISKELTGERKFELGNSVSYITLQRFFEDDYRQSAIHDLRFLKTLDKLCIFLGYRDLNTFISHLKKTDTITKKDNNTEDIDFFKKFILDYSQTEFECLQRLPEINIQPLYDYVFEGSPFIERIKMYSKDFSEKRYILNMKNNRSNFEIYGFELISQDENLRVIKTDEFWNLSFHKENSDERFVFFNRLNTQIYFIKKIDGVWKIWDNYNPDAGELTKDI